MTEDRGERAEWLAPVIPISSAGVADNAPAGADDASAAAETLLLRRLRTRSLSVAEARDILRTVEADVRESILGRFEDLGYLDDAALAEQIVRAGTERKGQGRRALAQSLAARGLRSEVVAAALATLPDDDAERALEFARSKVRRGMSGERDAELRRLVGQLSRRGYPSSVALAAAREALDERGRDGEPG